jgi:hypothetical protein
MSASRGSSHENPAGSWSEADCDLRVRDCSVNVDSCPRWGTRFPLSLALYAIQLQRYRGSDWNFANTGDPPPHPPGVGPMCLPVFARKPSVLSEFPARTDGEPASERKTIKFRQRDFV